MTLSRRRLLAAGLGAAVAGCSTSSGERGATDSSSTSPPPSSTATTAASSSSTAPETTTVPPNTEIPAPPYDGPAPFALGTASGDPDGTSFVLWTRLRTDPLEAGAFAESDLTVALDVATDSDFSELVHSAQYEAPAGHDHSVHAIVSGLEENSWYWYRFRLGDHVSSPARARTLPEVGTEPLRLGFSSCQNWESGAYAAHRHLVESDLDLFVWLGDYIYEYGPGNRGVVSSAGDRVHNTPEVTDLAGYRQRYALYKSDPSLQAHHASRPWIVTWDDHEVDNNYAGTATEDEQASAAFIERRRAAHKAWWENMPVRLDPPDGDEFSIHRTIRWGDLADIHMLDGRQHRDPQPTDGEPIPIGGLDDLGIRTLGPTAIDPEHSMLGVEQREWLEGEVAATSATWTVLANQVYMHGLNAFPGEQPATNPDSWDGYHGERQALLTSLASASDNLVVLTGDFHASTAAELRANPFDLESPVIGTEFMAPAISSTFPDQLRPLAPIVLGFNPQIRHFDPDNGFMTCEITSSTWTTRLYTLADVTAEESSIDEVAAFTVTAGTPGIASIRTTE